MVQFQLQFQNLTLEDIKDETQSRASGIMTTSKPINIAIAFDKGQILHPHPKLSRQHITIPMKGAILLSLPLGVFPKMAPFDNEQLNSVMLQTALAYFPLDESATELVELSKYPTSEVFLLTPTLKQYTKKTDLFLKTICVYYAMDDFLSRAISSATPLLLKEHFADLKRFLVNIMTGLYKDTEGIPNIEISFFNSILQAWFNIYLDFKKYVPGYDKYHTDFLNEVLNWLRYHKLRALHMGCNWEPTNQPYVLQKKLGGRKLILELIQLLNSTYVDPEIREHTLFSLFRESADLICNLVYDIVNLNGVAQGERTISRNSLYWNITKRGLSFETALEQHLLVINNEILDLQKAAKALEKEFGGMESVSRYVKNTMLYVDGSIKYLLSQERYGKCELKIMKVVHISHKRF